MPPSAIDPPLPALPSSSTQTNPPSKHTTSQPEPITRLLSEFVSSLTYDSIPTPVLAHLKVLLLDYLGVASYGSKYPESSSPFYTAIRTLNGPHGTSSTFTHGTSFQPQYAMLLNGAYAHTLDFDDTHLGGVVHPGVSVISASLTEAETLNASGKQLLTAIAAGYEVVCRLGLGLGSGGFAKGFHNTSTCGIFGAIAAIASLRGLSAEMVEMAFGIGISKTAGCMQYLVNGAWNKRLHPGFAAHDGFLAVAFAEAGVLAATNAIEGDHGFLRLFGSNLTSGGITEDLGSVWRCEHTAIKPYPACRLTHGAIDLASALRLSAGTKPVKSIKLELSPLSYKIVGIPVPNKVHPENNVDAQFSAFYQTAITWLDGSENGWSVYDHLLDGDVASLINRIQVSKNEKLSNLQTRITVEYQGGTSEVGFCEAPVGESSNPLSFEKIRKKYLSLMEPVVGLEASERIETYVTSIEGRQVESLMKLVA